ncbi:phenazine biosynthesis-like protein [Skeletonema marinoi]|uniref:Phenazine biosynthesis-like protein n=1 Tax=Skeletonema marinoi TaxID=267567 RepID=A0AAD9DHF3_9STRA|nr:phenazine biosynthesis-like protein [Skeletonema marinoi]
MMANNTNFSSSILDRIIFRAVQPTDIPRCYQIESASYPEDEAASKSTLQYRQHHAAPFFRCAFLIDNGGSTSHTDISNGNMGGMGSPSIGGTTSTSSSISRPVKSTPMNLTQTLKGRIIGYICSTRCSSFTEEAMKSHDATGKYWEFIVAMMKDYLSAMERLNSKEGILKVKMDKIVLIAKKNLLAFYVRNGFRAMGISSIVHGKEQWFELERDLPTDEDANKHKCFLLDSFADVDKEGSGNPAGVVLLDESPGGKVGDVTNNNSFDDEELDDIMEDGDDNNVAPEIPPRGVEWMAAVAKEFNQSETAFIWPLPNYEVSEETCVCPPKQQTLTASPNAYAFVIIPDQEWKYKTGRWKQRTFYAKHDKLQAELIVSQPSLSSSMTAASINNNNSNASRIAMDFPWKNVTLIPAGGEDHKAVLNMLSNAFFGTSIKAEVESDLKAKFCAFFNQKTNRTRIGTTDVKEDLFIELTEEGFDLLRGIKVDYSSLSEWLGYSRGVIICCVACKESSEVEIGGNRPGCKPVVDFRSRFFGPKVGIDEDPVTGSAHCSLGPYFGTKLGKKVVIGKQESERGGLVECILKQEEGRVCIVGTAVMTVSGMLSMPI